VLGVPLSDAPSLAQEQKTSPRISVGFKIRLGILGKESLNKEQEEAGMHGFWIYQLASTKPKT
jgi:hypothetical protein